MEISLYNNTASKVFATVNGIKYIIEPGRTSVAKCVAGIPVKIELWQKIKSFAILNLFNVDNMIDWDWFESICMLSLKSTYILNTNSDNQCFKICKETFNCDKYYQYDRLYLDDPIIKNDCTYEITRQKKIKKRVKLFNIYTLICAVALLYFAVTLFINSAYVKAGAFFTNSAFYDEIVISAVIGLIGAMGKIRVMRRYKKITDENYIRDCFKGYIEESKN